ncbi:MAG: GDP-mannose 4,6-dehydratase [Candidatus Omnitrophica bacterium]|nr:GDP-mannose 4,6-dehydratase [Candidatus Omnitrophota bacterium]
MRKVLLTGAAGFIGSHLSEKLLQDRYQVIAIDNFDPFYSQKFKRENIKNVLKNSNYFFIEEDIRNFPGLTSVFKQFQPIDTIIHLAAKAGVRKSIKSPKTYYQVNVLGTKNLLELAKDFKVKKFIFSSSSSVYGESQIPFSENEKNLQPLSPYGKTKLEAENLCKKFYSKFHIPIIILRLFSVYGLRGRPDMAPYLFTKAAFEGKPIKQYGDGLSARDWTYIDDIVEGIVKTLKIPLNFEIINLGGSKPIKLKTLIATIENLSRKTIKKIILPTIIQEPQITFANIKKAKRILNWQAKTGFNEGIEKFINWFKNNRLKSTLNY